MVLYNILESHSTNFKNGGFLWIQKHSSGDISETEQIQCNFISNPAPTDGPLQHTATSSHQLQKWWFSMDPKIFIWRYFGNGTNPMWFYFKCCTHWCSSTTYCNLIPPTSKMVVFYGSKIIHLEIFWKRNKSNVVLFQMLHPLMLLYNILQPYPTNFKKWWFSMDPKIFIWRYFVKSKFRASEASEKKFITLKIM